MALSSKLGHFNVLEEIAHGGMGTVYRAFDPTLNREVAIKVLRENLAQDPKFLNDFRQEARSAAAISHPHVVQVYFVGEATDQYYIVMELLHGRTLREIIEEDGPMGEERALQLTIDVVEGLRAAYNKNQMIHGDIKPANIFITQDVGAKVLDFGLSKLANVEVAAEEGIWGSPYYISP
jgi:serine/threonine-protein kinase